MPSSDSTEYGEHAPFQAAPRMQEQFELSGPTKTIGPQHFYPTVHAAVQAFAPTQAEPS